MKKQTRRVGVAGGVVNQMMGNNSTLPVVGEGATLLSYSDRHAYEVIEVSSDGNQCVIREMDCKFVGESYGDESYEYSSNEGNHTRRLEWNDKRGCWGDVWHSVEVIKALQNRLIKEFGWDWSEHLPVPYESLWVDDEEAIHAQLKLVKGVTKIYKQFNKTSVIFGLMEQYRDPTF